MVPAIGLNATASLRALSRSVCKRGVRLYLAELRDDVAEELRAHGAETDLGPIAAHRLIEECLQAAGIVYA
jgi:hypothetical protein